MLTCTTNVVPFNKKKNAVKYESQPRQFVMLSLSLDPWGGEHLEVESADGRLIGEVNKMSSDDLFRSFVLFATELGDDESLPSWKRNLCRYVVNRAAKRLEPVELPTFDELAAAVYRNV